MKPGREAHPTSNIQHPTSLVSGARITGLGTLASRLLGLVRDMATAALFGLAGGGVLDALVVALRVPNLFRALLGEGALANSYLPAFAAAWERDRRTAWQLTSVVLTWLALVLAALVVVGEAIYAWTWFASAPDQPGRLLAGLGATLLPYLLLVCLAAQLSATLNALGNFSVPALTPVIFNLCWLAAVWFIAPRFAHDREAQAYAIAVAILIAGVLQVAVQAILLRAYGFRFDYAPTAVAEPLRGIGRTLLPMVLGMTVTQINTFLDSMIAWGLAAPPEGPREIAWLGGVRYPLEQGAAAAIYFGERMYWLPLGLLGMALATAIFPLLSRHAARGDRDQLGADLSFGLRLVLCLGMPAGVGLVALAAPLTELLFEHGAFSAADTARAARVVAAYSLSVWAYCGLPVLTRGFFAVGDSATPAKLAAAMIALNLALNLTLIWPLAEAGLAVATAVCAAIQFVILTWLFSRRVARLDARSLVLTAARALLAALIMAAVSLVALQWLPLGRLFNLVLALAAAGVVYAAIYRLLGGRELAELLKRH